MARLLSMVRTGGAGGLGVYESWYFEDSVQGCTGLIASLGFSRGSAEVGATRALALDSVGGLGRACV